MLDGRFARNSLEDPPLSVLDDGLVCFDELEFASGRVEGFEQSSTQLFFHEACTANTNHYLCRVLEEGHDPLPRLTQELPICLDAPMAVILALAGDRLSSTRRGFSGSKSRRSVEIFFVVFGSIVGTGIGSGRLTVSRKALAILSVCEYVRIGDWVVQRVRQLRKILVAREWISSEKAEACALFARFAS